MDNNCKKLNFYFVYFFTRWLFNLETIQAKQKLNGEEFISFKALLNSIF